jgi:hypothetical protein
MTLSFSMEHTGSQDPVRGIIWLTMTHGSRPVTLVHDIAEGDSTDIMSWLHTQDPAVTHVRMRDGTLDEPDCLTVYEAAEAAMLPWQFD